MYFREIIYAFKYLANKKRRNKEEKNTFKHWLFFLKDCSTGAYELPFPRKNFASKEQNYIKQVQ